MSSFEDTLREMAEGGQGGANIPVIEVIITTEESIGFQQAQLDLGSIRQEVLGADPIVSNVTQDHTVNSFAAETTSALGWEDLQNVRSTMRNAVRGQGYTIEGTSIRADVKQRSL